MARPLDMQTRSYLLGGAGISDRTDPLTSTPPQLAVLENAVFSTNNRLSKRPGYRRLSRRVLDVDAPLADVQAGMTYGDELVACDKESLYSYDPNTDAWINKGHLQSLYCTQDAVVRDSATQTSQDESTHAASGVKVSVWEQEGGARYAVFSGNRSIQPSVLIGVHAIKPKVVPIGNFLVVLWYDTSDFLIHGATLPVANPTTLLSASATAITANLGDAASVSHTQPNFDACVVSTSSGEQLYLAFNNAAGGSSIWRFLAAAPLAVASTFARAASVALTINVFGDRFVEGPVLSWYDGGQIWFAAYDSDLLEELGSGILAETPFLPDLVPLEFPAIISITGVSLSDTSVDLVFFWTVTPTIIIGPVSTPADPLRHTVCRSRVTGGSTFSVLSYMLGDPWMDSVAYVLDSFVDGLQLSTLGYMLGLEWSETVAIPTATTVVVKRGVGIATKAFYYNGIAYVNVAYETPKNTTVIAAAAQNAYFTLNEDGAESTKLLAGLGGGIPKRADNLGMATLAEVSILSDSRRRFVLLATDKITIGFAKTLATVTPGDPDALTIQTQTGVVSDTVDFFNPTNSYLRAEIGKTLNISGGFISMYDGRGPVELGYHVSPEQVHLAATKLTYDADGIAAGTYTYVACFEWTDNQGQTHYSSPSVIQQITLPGGFYPDPHATVAFKYEVLITVNPLHLTQKLGVRGNARIGIYRTMGATNGTTFFNVGYVENNPDVYYLTMLDTKDDGLLNVTAALYAQPGVTLPGGQAGEIQNVPPGPVTSLCVYANRLIALSSTDTLTVWYSKQCIPTQSSVIGTPVAFYLSGQLTCDPTGGDLTAVGSLDDKLLMMKSGAVYFVTGQGPSSNGQNSDYSIPTLDTTACGCTNPRSVTVTPTGLLFQTAKGFWQVTRGLQGQYTGADAQNFSQQRVTSGLTVPNTTQVRLTLAQSDANPVPTAVMYDYYANMWGTFTGIAAVDAALWQGQYTWLRSDGFAFVETPGLFTDAGQFIPMKVTTSWFRLAGLEGFQQLWKVMLLGTYRTPHTLRVRLAYNNNPNFTQEIEIDVSNPGTWGSDSVWGGGAIGDSTVWGGEFPSYEWELLPEFQACEALQITIQDTPLSPYPPGESASFSALSFEYGTERGLNRRPAKNTAG